MRRAAWALLAVSLLGACAPLPEERLKDRRRLSTLKQGMQKEFVLEQMGTELVTVRGSDGRIRQIVPNPYETRILEIQGKKFEVVYYFTETERRDGPIQRDELTPFIFDNHVLIGWGWDFMDFLKKSAELPQEPEPDPEPDEIEP